MSMRHMISRRGGDPQREDHVCALSDDAVPRRTVLRGLVTAGAAVTAAMGGLVGFAPSAFAAPRCDAASPSGIVCGLNYRPCIGECVPSSFASCCRHSDFQTTGVKCCASRLSSRRARVVVYSSGKGCFVCCQYC